MVALGVAVAGVATLGVAWLFVFQSDTLGVAAGLDGYTTDRGQLQARIWLTNTGSAHAVINLGYRCVVETPHGSTNYAAGVPNGWLMLRPQQGAVLSPSRDLVPLPADARKWRVTLSARRQTSKERIRSSLLRWGILDYRKMNRHPSRYRWLYDSGPERVNNGCEEIQSGWIEVPPVGTTRIERAK